jgi:hypothetical protein
VGKPLSIKDIGKKGSGNKGYVLTVKCGTHNGHELVDDSFQLPGHLKSSDEYMEAIRQAKKHRQQVLPCSDGRRLIDVEEPSVIVSAKDYYNTVRKEIPDKSKLKAIVALLRMVLGKEHPDTLTEHERPGLGAERSGQVGAGGSDASTSTQAV